jgi:cysteate synthase
MKHFKLLCLQCGREHTELTMRCENGCSSLLRACYAETRFRPNDHGGLFRFAQWLPCQSPVETVVGPAVYQCEAFGRHLGLTNLFCVFGGYWPERGAHNPTATFKDFEALPTMLAFAEAGKRRLILASAGNTARAFAYATRLVDVEVVIVIPEAMLHRMWLPAGASGGRIKVLAVAGSADYADAIRLAEEISRRYGIDPEGGARNVARRDGMGTAMLEAARVLDRLPDHYFQAVGSGTGAIAAYEAAVRVLGDERFAGQALPRLHLSQNVPFLPLYHAWRDGAPIDPEAYGPERLNGAEVYASVLANRNPPYAICGGVADALAASRGQMYAVETRDAIAAGHRFQELEGIDLEPAAAVAAASLEQAVQEGRVGPTDLVLLNVTGGGLERLCRDFDCRPVAPDLMIDDSSLERLSAVLDT